MRKVVVFGVFDLLHPGHLYFLRAAKKRGDYLTVVVTRDARARAEKGRTPFFNERERLRMVRALKMVDRAVLGDPVGKWRILARLKPELICLGYDQKINAQLRCAWPALPRTMNATDVSLRSGQISRKATPQSHGRQPMVRGLPKIIQLKPFRAKQYHSSKIAFDKAKDKGVR